MLLFTEEDINPIASVDVNDILDKYIAGIISVGKAAELLNLDQFTVMKMAKARELKTYIDDGGGKLHDKYKPLLDDYDGMMVETPTKACKTCAHLIKFSRPPIPPTYMCMDPEGKRTTYNGKGGYGGNITIGKHWCAYWSNDNDKMVEKPNEMQMPKEPKVRFDVSPDFVLFLDIPTIIGVKVIIPDCSIYAVTVKIYSTSDTYPAIDFKGPGKEERARECKARLDKLVSDYRKNDTKDLH